MFQGRDPVAPPAMPSFPLCARSWLWCVLVSALLPACPTDDPEELSDDAVDDGADEGDGDVDGEPSRWWPLVRNDAWQPDVAEDDPLVEHRPAHVECEHGWYPESGGIEIDTGACSYLSLQQPLLAPLEPGDPVHLQLWWQSLASVDPAEGHLAILVDGELLWEELVPIPGPAATRNLDFPSPLGAPAGATLTLHLHNHGYNTWHFHELSALGPEAARRR